MFGKKAKKTVTDIEQHELLEKAQERIKQKKRLYNHFILFLIGSVFLIIINKFLKYAEEYNWFLWAITLWAFLFVIHFINVFITNTFLGKDWERKQRDRLIAKQKAKIAKIEQEVSIAYPLPEIETQEAQIMDTPTIKDNTSNTTQDHQLPQNTQD